MSIVSFKHDNDFFKLSRYLDKIQKTIKIDILNRYGREGVSALQAATPIDSGKTSESWYYVIKKSPGTTSIEFCNSNENNGVPIAIILYYGHGTRNGGYVQGRDYINPAIRPIFDNLADKIWNEVIKL